MRQGKKLKQRHLFVESATPFSSRTTSNFQNRGYRCVYDPPYSPELNPIEQFWSVCKKKIKREKLLEKETFTSRLPMLATVLLLVILVISEVFAVTLSL
jgi:transposase